MRKLGIEWGEFEIAIDPGSSESRGYLDVQTGAVFVAMDEIKEQLEALFDDAPPGATIETVLAGADMPD